MADAELLDGSGSGGGTMEDVPERELAQKLLIEPTGSSEKRRRSQMPRRMRHDRVA